MEAMIVIKMFKSLSFQFLLPLMVAGIANASIYCKLKVWHHDVMNKRICQK